MENDIQEQLAHQREILRDLQSQLAQSTDEEERKSLQLKMNVVDAKIKELQAKQSSAPVNEGTPENTKDFHNELTDEQLDEASWKVGDRVKIKNNYFDSTPSTYFNNQTGKISKVYSDYVEIELDKPVLGDKFITIAFNGLIKENTNMLNESLPSNYSKSKYLKEVQDATKAIRTVCERIDKLAKKGDEWSMYSLPSDFKSIANFAERCAEDSKDIYSYMKKGTLTEAVESKRDFLKHLDNYEKDIKKAIDSIRKNIKDSKKTSGMDGDYLVSISSAISNALTRYNHSVDTKTLTEAVLPQDKAQWADAVKFGKAHGHPAPKLKLGQKTSKGEVVALWYGRFSAAPMYSVSKDGGKTVKEYYEEELMEGCMTKKFETKGMLSESQNEDYIIKQVCLYAKPQMFKSKGVTPAMLATAIGDYIATIPNSSDIFNVNYFAKILDKIITSRKENPNKYILQKVEKNCSKLFEGCMTKKFENMTNREIASYIFSHPHTKFASKMKECDDKEIMKAIRAMKKTEEEAPVTNTSAVATTEVPSMFMKKKLNESIDSDITDILDDVKNMYGEKARRDLRDEIYHRNYLVTRDSFASYVKQLSKTGMLRDFIEAIINRDTYTFDKIVRKLT